MHGMPLKVHNNFAKPMPITGMSKNFALVSCSADSALAVSASTRKNLAAGHITVRILEQSHCEIALADAEADARRKGVSAIYLRYQAPERANFKR